MSKRNFAGLGFVFLSWPLLVWAAEPATTSRPLLAPWLAEVLAENPARRAAAAAVDAARARLRAARRPLFNPELELGYEETDTRTTTGGIGLTLDWSNKREARAAVAEGDLQAAIAELQASEQIVVVSLLAGLAEAETSRAVAGIAARRAELMQRFSALAQLRREAGDLNQVELDLAYLAAAEAKFQRAAADAAVLRAERDLAELTPRSVHRVPVLPPYPPVVDKNLNAREQLDALPAIRAQQARVAAARATETLTMRERRPDPTVGFRVGREGEESLAAVSLSIPLFVRNNRRAEVDAAGAELARAAQELANQRRRAAAQLEAAKQTYRLSRDTWLQWAQGGMARLEERAALLTRLWRAGELSTTDYLVQLKQTLDTESGAMEQRSRMWQAWAAWLAASGGSGRWLAAQGGER